MYKTVRANLGAGIKPERRLQLRQYLRRLRHPAWLGTLRRTMPLSDCWGHDRGIPIDRYYIEQFLAMYRADIHGAVLEIKDSGYTNRFGSNVQRRDVLDIDPANPQATIVVDLATADAIESDSFDCFVLTQTLQFICDPRNAIKHAQRILRPGGVLLATVPAISRVERAYVTTDYWRFTPASCTALFGAVFGAEQTTVRPYGNVLAATAFLTGMAYEELAQHELDAHDPYFPVMVAVRAVKRAVS